PGVQPVAVVAGGDEGPGGEIAPVAGVRGAAAREHRRPVLERNRYDAAPAAGRRLQGVRKRRGQQPLGGNAGRLLRVPPVRGRDGRDGLVTVGADAADPLPRGAVVPLILNDTVRGG